MVGSVLWRQHFVQGLHFLSLITDAKNPIEQLNLISKWTLLGRQTVNTTTASNHIQCLTRDQTAGQYMYNIFR